MLRSLLPPSVHVAESSCPSTWTESDWPSERAAVAVAVERRRLQHGQVRHLARMALMELGIAPAPLLSGDRREPLWPAGVVGSLTHCDTYCAAAVARAGDVLTVGIDAEMASARADRVAGRIFTPKEIERIEQLVTAAPTIPWSTVWFSAKEAIYKAWYPVTHRWLGFHDVDLVCTADGTFAARLLVDAPAPMAVVSGRFTVETGVVVAAACVEGTAYIP